MSFRLSTITTLAVPQLRWEGLAIPGSEGTPTGGAELVAFDPLVALATCFDAAK
jgi:hypothetical protein